MFEKFKLPLFFTVLLLLSCAAYVFGDGFLDKEAGVKGSTVQSVSPKYGSTYRAALGNAATVGPGFTAGSIAAGISRVNVSKLKKIKYAATSSVGAAQQVKIFLYNLAGTIEPTVWFVDPTGVGEISIGTEVGYVGFAQYSSATVTSKIHVWGR